MAGQPYSITITNSSAVDNQNAIVFQTLPTLPQDVRTLAWLTKKCHMGTWVEFDWTLDFNFVWGQSGTLSVGANYMAGQVIPADLTINNQVTLSYDGGFSFSDESQGPEPGSLFIKEDNSVPGPGSPDQGNVGIGMSGVGTFVVPTLPTGNGGVQFEVSPQYWVAFGSYEQGTVITEDILTFPVGLDFSPGQFNADCTFTGLGWNINYS
jgi:rhizosphere induced protein